MPNDTEGRVVTAEASTVELLNRSEIDQQIATAHKYPRNVAHFRDVVLSLATLNEDVAEECSYALPRDNKTIIGPSARFAEILVSAWGNCRAGARVVDDKGTFVVAQGAFLDLQANVAITYEVQRRIVDKNGRRYKDDMVGVTANAACSIALRNAILKGIPKALWADLWEKARKVAVGDATTLSNRRAAAVQKLSHFGVTEKMILDKLQRPSLNDVTVDDIGVLLGIFTALKEGDSTVEQLFTYSMAEASSEPTRGAAALAEAMAKARGSAPKQPSADVAPPADEPVLSYAEIADGINRAKTTDDFALMRDGIRTVKDAQQQTELTAMLDARIEQVRLAAARASKAVKETLK